MKAIVLFKDGFEEIEALSVVDVLRRESVECKMVGMDLLQVKGSHDIVVTMDEVFSGDYEDVDIVILPGGMPGAKNLKEDARVIKLLQDFEKQNKWIAAICAAPIALNAAGILKNKHYTCYPGFEKEIENAVYEDVATYVDGYVITARGPAVALDFSYLILEKLGIDATLQKKAMQYDYISK